MSQSARRRERERHGGDGKQSGQAVWRDTPSPVLPPLAHPLEPVLERATDARRRGISHISYPIFTSHIPSPISPLPPHAAARYGMGGWEHGRAHDPPVDVCFLVGRTARLHWRLTLLYAVE